MSVPSPNPDRLAPLQDFFGGMTPDGKNFTWWVFPSRRNPRFVIPTEKKFWREGLAFVSSGKKRMALRGLLHLSRLIRRKPDLELGGRWPEILQRSFDGEVVHFAAYVSTPSRFSKYTLVLLNQAAEPLGFAKLSEGKDADQAIEAEVDALVFLAKEFPGSPSFPHIIDSQRGFAIQSPAPSSNIGDLSVKAGRLAGELFQTQCKEVPWSESSSRNGILEAIDDLRTFGRDDLGDLLGGLERQLSEVLGTVLFREGLTHGDFARWNMADSEEGFVFDWEWMGRRAEFHDLFHYLWIQELQSEDKATMPSLAAKWHSQDAVDLLRGYNSDGEGPLYRHALLYLATSFAFYARHCVANRDDPLAFPFMGAILRAFQEFAKLDGGSACHAPSHFLKSAS